MPTNGDDFQVISAKCLGAEVELPYESQASSLAFRLTTVVEVAWQLL